MRLTQAVKNVIDQNPKYGTRLQQAEKLAKKWQKLGLMEGLSEKNTLMRTNVAIMLQNQGKQILRESNHTSNAKASEEWVGIAMPLIRRFMHKLVAKEFVTIQAMSQPTGLVFFIDHQFGSNRKGFERGGSLYGTDFKGNSGDSDYVMDTNIAAGLYGAGQWGYSLNDKKAAIGSGSINKFDILGIDMTPTYVTGSAITSADWMHDTRFFNNNSSDGITLDKNIRKFTVKYPAHIEKNGIDAFHFDLVGALNDSATSQADLFKFETNEYRFSHIYKEYTRISGDNITFIASVESNSYTIADGLYNWVKFEGDLTFSTKKMNILMSYHVQPEVHDRGDFEYKGDDLQTDDINIPEVQFKLTQKPIVPKTRKMKATWTQELVDDLNALLAIDGEQEISNQLTDQITLETDLEILSMIGKGAIKSENAGFFSAIPGNEVKSINKSTGVVTFDKNDNYYVSGKSDWYRNIGVPMQKVSNMIHQKTGRGGANFAIVSPQVATLFESMEGFSMNTDGTQEWMQGGITAVGNFKSRYKIYKNPYSVSDNTVIMGYRGTGFLDFGAAYCPYIPLIMTPTILEPTNLTPTKGVYTRYAKTMLRQDYYGALYVHGLESV